MHGVSSFYHYPTIVVMATSKPPGRKQKIVYSKIKDPVKPKWIRITKSITIVVLSIVLLLAMAGMLLKYFHLISNHL